MLANRYSRYFVSILLSLLLAGCSLPKQQESNIQTYLFSPTTIKSKTVTSSTHTTNTAKEPTIKINPISASAPFNSSFFIFKFKRANYQKDYYHRFLALPTIQLQQIAMDNLEASGNFSKVLNDNTAQIPNYEAIFTLRELYVDASQANKQFAVIVIEARVNKMSLADTPTLFFDRTYRQMIPIYHYNSGAQQIVIAWDKGIANIFKQFNADWHQAITESKSGKT